LGVGEEILEFQDWIRVARKTVSVLFDAPCSLRVVEGLKTWIGPTSYPKFQNRHQSFSSWSKVGDFALKSRKNNTFYFN